MTDVKGVLLLILAIVVALFIWRVQSKLSDYDQMKDERKALVERVDELEGRAAAYDAALLEKAEREQFAREVRRNINTNLEGVQRNDSESGAYLSGVIPDGVRDGWRRGTKPAADAGAVGP